MIDTIILTLAPNMYQISEPHKFTPSAHWALLNDARTRYSVIKSKQNATKRELLNGIYKPHLTLAYHRGIQGTVELLLKIELSLPKLLYGNNFNELRYKDFTVLTHKLASTLATMGITTTAETLAQAPVLTIHYSKNIPLTDGSTPYHYINKIREANVRLSLDTNQTDYRNEGLSALLRLINLRKTQVSGLRRAYFAYYHSSTIIYMFNPLEWPAIRSFSEVWHCNSYEVVFYDKIKDLEKAKQSSKHAIEKDSELQQHLFDAFKKRNKLEFLRMEVRLNKRKKIKQLLGALAIKTDLTFKKLFKPAIAKKVLLHYLGELERNRSPLLNCKIADDKTFLAQLAFNNPTITPRQSMMILGFKRALEAAPLRELKTMIGKDKQQS